MDSTEKWLRMREFWRFTKQIYRNASRVRDQFFVYDKNEDDMWQNILAGPLEDLKIRRVWGIIQGLLKRKVLLLFLPKSGGAIAPYAIRFGRPCLDNLVPFIIFYDALKMAPN